MKVTDKMHDFGSLEKWSEATLIAQARGGEHTSPVYDLYWRKRRELKLSIEMLANKNPRSYKKLHQLRRDLNSLIRLHNELDTLDKDYHAARPVIEKLGGSND